MTKVSVIIPVFNGGRFLKKAVMSMLNQTFRDFELLIIDDGSTDGSDQVLRRLAAADPRIRLILRENRGMAYTMRQLVEEAQYDLLARMDQDDISLPDRLRKQVAYLEAHPECVAVGSQVIFIGPKGWALGRSTFPAHTQGIVDNLLLRGPSPVAIIHPTILMRKEAVLKVGNYNPDFDTCEDRDLWLRLAEVGEVVNLDEPLIKYRFHPKSVTHRKSGHQRKVRRLVVEAAYRRRGEAFPSDFVDANTEPGANLGDLYADWAAKSINFENFAPALCYTLLTLVRRPFAVRSWYLLLRVGKLGFRLAIGSFSGLKKTAIS